MWVVPVIRRLYIFSFFPVSTGLITANCSFVLSTRMAAVDPANVASTLAKINDQQGDEHAIAMSDLPPSSTDEWANIGPRPNSSQDLRTSFL